MRNSSLSRAWKSILKAHLGFALTCYFMKQPSFAHVECTDPQGHHRMAYVRWGDPLASHVVLCVHGLTRQGRDFDKLAQALVDKSPHPLQVICPDVVGRGQSDWLAHAEGYQIPQYASDMLALLAHLQQQAPVQTLDWVGTSMGGLIGMVVAGQAQWIKPCAVRRLVLNDVGPVVSWPSIERMKSYVGKTGRFESLEEAADALWAVSQSFGPHSREVWLALSAPMLKRQADGSLTLNYDPAIGESIRAVTQESTVVAEQMLWHLYEQITASTLLLRGVQSDLLTPETAKAMQMRGPCAKLVEFAGVGHAPTLTTADQIQVVADFLLGE
jgi:pimeloyl-ACP methyl ester carboxylesterase